jgi:hypothetical protein
MRLKPPDVTKTNSPKTSTAAAERQTFYDDHQLFSFAFLIEYIITHRGEEQSPCVST